VGSSLPMAIGVDETAEALGTRLADAGANLLREVLPAILAGAPSLTPQDESRVTVCRKIDKRAGLVDWRQESASEISRKVRAFTPWPGCASYLGTLRLGLVRVEELAVDGETRGRLGADGVVAAAGGSVRLLEVKPEGRAAMPFAAFANGHPEAIGQTLQPAPT
jgi:methionyl-tRNA formyltransferase